MLPCSWALGVAWANVLLDLWFSISEDAAEERDIFFGGLSELSVLGLLDELTQMTFDCLNPYQPERKG